MSNLLLTWEQFIYEISALGFVYDKRSHSWKREDGAAVVGNHRLDGER